MVGIGWRIELTSSLERFLCGVMNREIKVRFVVQDQDYDLDNSGDEDDEDSSETDSDPLNWISIPIHSGFSA
jgi:hypothetical protein